MKIIRAIRVPFVCKIPGCDKPVKLSIQFDAIEGRLPFLIGLLSLPSMRGTLGFLYSSLLLTVHEFVYRFELLRQSSHLELPLVCNVTNQRALREYNGSYDAAESGVCISRNQSSQNLSILHPPTFLSTHQAIPSYYLCCTRKRFTNSLDTRPPPK